MKKLFVFFIFVLLLSVFLVWNVSSVSAQLVAKWTRHSFGETLQIDSYGNIFLNGNKVVAVGFHLKHGTSNPSQTVAETMLQRLSSDDVRFMTLNFAGWETDQNVISDINFWMPLLAKYKMWTFLQVQHVGETSSGPPLTVQVQLPRHQLVLNTISQNMTWANMVYAYTVAWELDIWSSNTEASVANYLSQMTPQVKTLLSNSAIGNVPILNKPSDLQVTGRGNVAMGQYEDLVGNDHYLRVSSPGSGAWASMETTFENYLHNTYLSAIGKTGYAIWHTEGNIAGTSNTNTSPSPGQWTQNLFNSLLDEFGHHDCGSVMIWNMWNSVASGQGLWSAFGPDGTPTQWYLTIASLFPSVPPSDNPPPNNPPANNTQPLSVSVSASVSSVHVGESVVLNAVASGGSSPYTYQWKMNSQAIGSSASFTRVMATNGSFVFTCTVTDAASSSVTSNGVSVGVVSVNEPLPPSSTIDYSPLVIAGSGGVALYALGTSKKRRG